MSTYSNNLNDLSKKRASKKHKKCPSGEQSDRNGGCNESLPHLSGSFVNAL